MAKNKFIYFVMIVFAIGFGFTIAMGDYVAATVALLGALFVYKTITNEKWLRFFAQYI